MVKPIFVGGADCRAGGLIKQIVFRWCLVSCERKILGGGRRNCSALRSQEETGKEFCREQSIKKKKQRNTEERNTQLQGWRAPRRDREMEAELDKGISKGGWVLLTKNSLIFTLVSTEHTEQMD